MASTHQRRWRELHPKTRAAVIGAGIVQLSLLVAALADLHRRRPEEVNGPVKLWVGVSFINFIGPIAYFVFGRRRQARDS